MADLSNTYAQKTLNCIFNKQQLTPPSSLWFALFTTNPTGANTGTEVSGSGYSRVQITAMTFAELVAGNMQVSNSSKISMPRATGDWTQSNYWAVMDAQTGGNLIVFEALVNSADVKTGEMPELNAGDLTITISG